jgi:dihydroorotate dehydrogenase (fumarate)
MDDLNVTFAGLALKSPLIVEFTEQIPPLDILPGLVRAGAGAFLLPKLDRTRLEWTETDHELTEHNRSDTASRNAEALQRRINQDAYMEAIETISRETSLPVIAALQLNRRDHWINMAHAMADAGASVVELHPVAERDWRTVRTDQVEKEIVRVSAGVGSRLDLPIVVRLVAAPYGMQALVQSLSDSHVKGVILAGSDYLATIDPDTSTTDTLATDGRRGDAAFMNALAVLQLLYRRVAPHLATRLPPDRPAALTESILAGATLAVLPIRAEDVKRAQGLIGEHLGSLNGWMRRKGFSSMFDFRGSLSDSRRTSSLENPSTGGS